ncbi:hypothetical protein [Devosia crocina]|uniref:hypothetical protein n=1 Tax=Devosia crocina TaxID=429728 RepID=UPI001113E21A|nr:hypothetical protein [Devosia crocina]
MIGQLILRMQQNVTPEANKVTAALKGIETASANLDRKRPQWGSKFDQQLQRLKVSPAEHAAIVASWDKLLSAIDGKTGRDRREGKAAWQTGVIAHLASMRTEIDKTEQRARVLNDSLRGINRFGGYLVGGTTAYVGYRATHGGVNAAFEQQRQQANAYFAGLPEEDRNRIKAASEELSAQYGIFSADMYEVLKEASLSMPNTDIALEAGDTMARLFVALEAMFGRSEAISGLYDLNKMADNAELNLTAEQYTRVMDQYLRAQQVLGKDLSPGDMKRAVQYARIAGKTLSENYLMTWLPIIAAETSGSDAGTQVRANFDQFIVGRASKQAQAKMAEWGIMEGGELVGTDLYGENQLLWANEILLPRLRDAGIDTDNMMELGRAIGQLTQNRQSSDLLARALISIEQYSRYAYERFPEAKGLASADEIRDMDPFAATTGMVNSLKNFAAAMGEHVVPVIIPAMNAFAGGVEELAQKVRDAEGWEVGLAALGVAVGGIGAVGVGKVGLAWLTAGPSLQAAATMLQSAAASLGGTAPTGAGNKPTGGKSAVTPVGSANPLMMLAPWLADYAGTMAFDRIAGEGATAQSREVTNGALERTIQRINQLLFAAPAGPDFASNPLAPNAAAYQAEIDKLNAEIADWGPEPALLDRLASLEAKLSGGGGGIGTGVDTSEVAAAGQKADEAALKLGALNATLRPVVDVNPITRLIGLLERAVSLQRQLGAGPTGGGDLDTRIRASFSDYGVSP